jgi:hypothetical protein
MNENNSPAPEIPTVEIPPVNPPPAPVVAAPAAPPVASLVVHGSKSEREIELEAKLTAADEKLRRAEFLAAEKEQLAQETAERLKRIEAAPKPKAKPGWSDPVWN